jgi:hypothetical protein
MRLRLTRRLGQNPEGSVIERGDSEGNWLVGQGHAVPEPERSESVPSSEATAGNDEGPSLKELQARATGLGLKTYGSKQQLAARIAAHEAEER